MIAKRPVDRPFDNDGVFNFRCIKALKWKRRACRIELLESRCNIAIRNADLYKPRHRFICKHINNVCHFATLLSEQLTLLCLLEQSEQVDRSPHCGKLPIDESPEGKETAQIDKAIRSVKALSRPQRQ